MYYIKSATKFGTLFKKSVTKKKYVKVLPRAPRHIMKLYYNGKWSWFSSWIKDQLYTHGHINLSRIGLITLQWIKCLSMQGFKFSPIPSSQTVASFALLFSWDEKRWKVLKFRMYFKKRWQKYHQLHRAPCYNECFTMDNGLELAWMHNITPLLDGI